MFKAGMFIGRMQHIHNLHEKLIRHGMNKCEKFLVFVGSAQIARDENNLDGISLRNPFPVGMRIRLLEEIFSQEIKEGRLIVAPLDDLTTEDDISYEWGRYLLDNAEKVLGQKLDYMVYGNDESRAGWFSPEDIENIYMECIDRVEGTISATQLRKYLLEGDKENWMEYTNPAIHSYFNILCLSINLVKIYLDIRSRNGG
jgi:bifunctional NMN adenylyltransferase/nudix hydrolase